MESDTHLEGAAKAASDFFATKQPRTDVERVLCLAHCLTNIFGRRTFASTDISRLNLDLGMQKFSNPSFAIRKARTRGLLSETDNGQLALTTDGIAYVEALLR